MLKSGDGAVSAGSRCRSGLQPVPLIFDDTAMPAVALLDMVTVVEPSVVQLLAIGEGIGGVRRP